MPRLSDETADVCLIVEGAYPFVVGGVSTWLQDLISSLPERRFAIVALKAGNAPMPWKIEPPANVVAVAEISLTPDPAFRTQRRERRAVEALATLLIGFLVDGGTARFAALVRTLAAATPAWTPGEVLAHPVMFRALANHAETHLPAASFHHFYWAARTLLGGLLAATLAPLPRAQIYHTISTGFAGLIAARAALATGRPAAITEHGIYLLERQIEIMMADWIGDQMDASLALDREVRDLRDLWRTAFEHYGRTCYDLCDPIIALYGANTAVQRGLGAAPERLRVIANGIDCARFADIGDDRDPDHPTIALIGRVVPIKDVKTFIRAAAIVHARRPGVRFAILGPVDEDADYAAECRALVASLGLGPTVTFEGKVRIDDWMSRIDLVVLTSLSEAQPLVILEAGACGIPIVTPDVGSCRELVEGRGGDDSAAGGIVTPLVDPEATAGAIDRLLADPALRTRMGDALRDRIRRDYDHATIIGHYRRLYDEGTARTTQPRSA